MVARKNGFRANLKRLLVVGGGLFGVLETEHLLPDGLHRVGSGFFGFSRHLDGFAVTSLGMKSRILWLNDGCFSARHGICVEKGRATHEVGNLNDRRALWFRSG